MKIGEIKDISAGAIGGLKRLLPLAVLAAILAGLAFKYQRLDLSKRRFIKHLARQLPYLPGRYYA